MNLILTFQVRVRDVVAKMHQESEARDAEYADVRFRNVREYEAREAACKKERDDRLAAFKMDWPDHEALVLRTQSRSPRNLNLQKLYSPDRQLFLDRVFNGLDSFHDDVPDKGE